MQITAHDLAASPEYEWVNTFRIVGGTAIYDTAEYRSDRTEHVLLAYVTSRHIGLHVVRRYVDPETEVEPLDVDDTYPEWCPGFALWTQYRAEQDAARATDRDSLM